MTAQNWMIGDWYQWYAECRYYPYQVKPEDFTKDYKANFEPIPLTPEILEKNGFDYKERSTSNAIMVKHGDGYVIEVFLFKNNCVFNIERDYYLNEEYVMDRVHKCGFYVHELQRALRCCGLTDLADNLKLD